MLPPASEHHSQLLWRNKKFHCSILCLGLLDTCYQVRWKRRKGKNFQCSVYVCSHTFFARTFILFQQIVMWSPSLARWLCSSHYQGLSRNRRIKSCADAPILLTAGDHESSRSALELCTVLFSAEQDIPIDKTSDGDKSWKTMSIGTCESYKEWGTEKKNNYVMNCANKGRIG